MHADYWSNPQDMHFIYRWGSSSCPDAIFPFQSAVRNTRQSQPIGPHASFGFHIETERRGLKIRQKCFVSVGEKVKNLFLLQVEELKNASSSSEKSISDATSKKELLEKAKIEEEEKLKQVMNSLKKETKGIQEEKEV